MPANEVSWKHISIRGRCELAIRGWMSNANDNPNRAVTKDCPFQVRLTSPLRFTTFFAIGLQFVLLNDERGRFGVINELAFVFKQGPRQLLPFG